MSLFGGDSSAPPTESEYESGSEKPQSAAAQSLPTASLRSPPSAQYPHDPHGFPGSVAGDEAHTEAGNEADSEESNDEEPERPNRFKGPAQTWKGYTAEERQIAESLQQLEHTDLAAHLYNAHALKRRVRKPASELLMLQPWQNKDVWLKQGKELQYTEVAGQLQTELIPAKDWTAWPLPPASLYTLSNGFRRAVVAPEEDEWVIGGIGPQDPGEELRDEMLSLFLRMAKENWNNKEWQDYGQQNLGNKAQSRGKYRSQSVGSDIEMADSSEDKIKHDESKVAVEGGTRRGRKPQAQVNTRPIILADDAKAQRLLKPTITSLLTKLDDVVAALQRTRLNHFGRRGFGDGSSQSEFTTDAETTEWESYSRSQSRAKSASRSKPVTRQSSRPSSSRASRAPVSPKKPSTSAVELEDSDSASDYGAHFGNEQDSSSNGSRSPSKLRKRSRSESTADEDVSTRDWSRAGLMDWSEVLGSAAVRSWDSKALARTAERCAALFGESMQFRPFHEELAAKSVAEPIQYTPYTVPESSSSVVGASRPTKRPYWQAGAIRCPHTGCYGHYKDFKVSYRVIEHCMRIHGYDPRSNDSDNEERTHGGVHIDGFLQPITAKQGWLGHGRSKAGGKKRKMDATDPADVAANAVSIGKDEA